MSPKQDQLYWREWGLLVNYCKAKKLPVPDRHALHADALGADKSHRIFSNEDFDRVLGVFRAISRPGSVDSQLRQLRQPAARLHHKIRRELVPCLRLYIDEPAAYVRAICQDKFGQADWTMLSDRRSHPDHPSQLEQLIMTLTRALNGARGLRASAHDSVHDMRTKAGLACGCAACNPRRVRLELESADVPF